MHVIYRHDGTGRRLEHCRAIGIEREAEYCADILERLRQGVLF